MAEHWMSQDELERRGLLSPSLNLTKGPGGDYGCWLDAAVVKNVGVAAAVKGVLCTGMGMTVSRVPEAAAPPSGQGGEIPPKPTEEKPKPDWRKRYPGYF